MAADLTRVLVAGWPSFPDGEATVGDVLAMEAVREELASAGWPCDLAWSPVLRPGALALADADPAPAGVPVTGVIMVAGQAEYGKRAGTSGWESLDSWLRDSRGALIPLDTRLDPRDWRLCTRPARFEAIVRRLDFVVTMRLHGLVLALSHGVPALAVDPVAGGAKVTAQARAWDWPAIVTAGPDADLDPRDLDHWRDLCLPASGRDRADRAADAAPSTPLGGLLAALDPVSAADAG